MNDRNVYMVYVTAGDDAEAKRIARAVVQERLAACANILGGIQSVYSWRGDICEDHEVALILKTSGECKNELISRIREIHSYETPCIVFLPISDGHPAFLDWIDGETRGNGFGAAGDESILFFGCWSRQSSGYCRAAAESWRGGI
ncbi:divalent-cation tolerance protein CutA [Verrucomicrobia bacterium S94]|nr:divalent-cation tolerance protein CutA [Verrucomicrobia bacterium S94]